MYKACRFAVYVQHILQKRPRCSEETTPSSPREATARARGPTRGDDGAAPLYAALQLVDGSHGLSPGYYSFGASGGHCWLPRHRASPSRPRCCPRSLAVEPCRPPRRAGHGTTRALAAAQPRLARGGAARRHAGWTRPTGRGRQRSHQGREARV